MDVSISPPIGLEDPEAVAEWVFAFETALARLRENAEEPPRGAFKGQVTEHDALLAMMRRWDGFNPANAEFRHVLIGKLQTLGYSLVEPVARSSKSGSRTYMRVLREDGVNAGFLNSSTFTFVRARAALPQASEFLNASGRYPSTDVNSLEAVNFIDRVVTQFRSMP